MLLAALALMAADAPKPFPAVYCAETSGLSARWELTLDPVTRPDQRRAERLLERHPEADGVRMALARSNLPRRWSDVDDVVLVGTEARLDASVLRAGVRPAPSGARFSLVLDAKPSALGGDFALAVQGAFDHEATLRAVRRDAADADLGTEVEVRRWLRSSDARGTPLRDGSVWFESVFAIDLDGNGDDELVVFEHWPEGQYVWLVRYDREAERLHAERLCGDAA